MIFDWRLPIRSDNCLIVIHPTVINQAIAQSSISEAQREADLDAARCLSGRRLAEELRELIVEMQALVEEKLDLEV